MIGQKGMPATWGGVERHVEELSAHLAILGHEVVVFTRPQYTPPSCTEYRGVRLRSLPTIPSKHLDAIVHSTLASFAVWAGDYDVVHYHAMGPTLASPIAKLRGRRVVATIHGQDWRGGKWGRLASTALKFSEWVALHVPDATIAVSAGLADEYRMRTSRPVSAIPSGVALCEERDMTVLGRLGVVPGGYLLFVGRLVPEKGLHLLLEAARPLLGSDMKLVVCGDSSYTGEYVDSLHGSAGGEVLWAGYRHGAELASLFESSAVCVAPSTHEGLPIVLLEAVGYGARVLSSDIPPALEVLGTAGSYFRSGSVEDLSSLSPG